MYKTIEEAQAKARQMVARTGETFHVVRVKATGVYMVVMIPSAAVEIVETVEAERE